MVLLKKALKNRLKGAERIAILGVGSDLRSDDAAGMLVAENVEKSKVSRNSGIPLSGKSKKVKVFSGGTAPENFTGQIKKFNPTHIIIVDAAQMGLKAGQARIIGPKDIANVSFSTHGMPLSMFTDYIYSSVKCDIIIIGIQPKSAEFGHAVSTEVARAAGDICGVLTEILKK